MSRGEGGAKKPEGGAKPEAGGFLEGVGDFLKGVGEVAKRTFAGVGSEGASEPETARETETETAKETKTETAAAQPVGADEGLPPRPLCLGGGGGGGGPPAKKARVEVPGAVE